MRRSSASPQAGIRSSARRRSRRCWAWMPRGSAPGPRRMPPSPHSAPPGSGAPSSRRSPATPWIGRDDGPIPRTAAGSRRNGPKVVAATDTPSSLVSLVKEAVVPQLLYRIASPHDLRRLGREELYAIAYEMRERIIDVDSRVGGHFAPGLGVVELNIALHYIFDTPRDKLNWDVGHQAYPHKLLTGRND